MATAPVGPPPPPPVPPIALKFITLIERPDRGEKIALLSDGRGGPSIFGKEGDVIEGRYKIVRIGTESIEVAYLDGHGRHGCQPARRGRYRHRESVHLQSPFGRIEGMRHGCRFVPVRKGV